MAFHEYIKRGLIASSNNSNDYNDGCIDDDDDDDRDDNDDENYMSVCLYHRINVRFSALRLYPRINADMNLVSYQPGIPLPNLFCSFVFVS